MRIPEYQSAIYAFFQLIDHINNVNQVPCNKRQDCSFQTKSEDQHKYSNKGQYAKLVHHHRGIEQLKILQSLKDRLKIFTQKHEWQGKQAQVQENMRCLIKELFGKKKMTTAPSPMLTRLSNVPMIILLL